MTSDAEPTQVRTTAGLVRRIHVDELPGRWSKTLEVQPGQQAVVARKGDAEILLPGRHPVGRPWGGGPGDVALIETTAFTLHPNVGGLLSGDGELMEADFLVRARVSDPSRLCQALGPDRDRLTVGELAGRVAAEMQSHLAVAVRSYAADDLCGSDAVAQQVGSTLRGFLNACLEPLGLEVQQVGHLVFLRAEDAVRRAEAVGQLRDRLRQTDAKARLSAIQSERDFSQAVQELDQELKLRDIFRQEELDEIKNDVLGGVAGASSGPRAGLDDLLTQKLAGQQEQLIARFEGLLKRLGYQESGGEKRSKAIAHLARWVTGLRIAGAIVIPGMSLVAIVMPGAFADPTMPQIVTAAGGVGVGVLAFASAFWIEGRIRAGRTAQEAQRELARLSPERRQAVDDMMRAQLSGALQQIESNLEQAWTRAYRGPLQELATSLRQLGKGAGTLRDEMRSTSYLSSSFVARKDAPTDQLQMVLDLNEGLLALAQGLAETSQALSRQVVERQPSQIESDARRLELGLQDLRNRLIKRDALVKGV